MLCNETEQGKPSATQAGQAVYDSLPKIALMCHNAEYQGDISTDMLLHDSAKLNKVATIWKPYEFHTSEGHML